EIKNIPFEVDFDESGRVAQFVVDEVARRDSRAEVLVSCFHAGTIDHVRQLDPGIPTAFLHHLHEGPLEEMIAGWLQMVTASSTRGTVSSTSATWPSPPNTIFRSTCGPSTIPIACVS